jgi:YfiH family protein
MLILKPHIFKPFSEIIFGFSTKFGEDQVPPFYFNLSLSVGDKAEMVMNNRIRFFSSLGMSLEKAVFQKQTHGNKISYVSSGGWIRESDAMITDKRDLALCISTADCTGIFIYDAKKKIIAAVHSGWRGTQKGITKLTIQKLRTDFKCKLEDLYIYLSPSVSQVNYEVGGEVAELFDTRYLESHGDKYFLDVSSANYDMLIGSGIPSHQIQKSNLCSFEYRDLFHSYRRDGNGSGRALGIIALKEVK